VPDRTLAAPGLRLIDTYGDTVGAPIDVGLPPNAVVVVPPAPPTGFVSTTDFVTGSYSTVNLRLASAAADLPAVPGIVEGDNGAVYFNDRVYVLNRFGFDSISVLETDDLTTAVRQFSTGNGSNPQDMAFVSDSRAYVSLLGSNELLRVNPTAAVGDEIRDRIDLSVYLDPNDADGLVEAGPVALVGRYLFVALQRLSDFVAVTDSLLAVVDTTNDRLVDVDPATAGVQGIELVGRNPVALEYVPELGRLLVSASGNFGVADGGVEAVDPFRFVSEGYLQTEAALGGDVGPIASVAGRKVYAVAGGFEDNRLLVFDLTLAPETGTYTGGAPRDLGLSLPFVPSLAVDGARQLLVPDRTLAAPGLRLIDTYGDTVGAPIDVGLPPNDVVVLYR
jgi:hypothetical protein